MADPLLPPVAPLRALPLGGVPTPSWWRSAPGKPLEEVLARLE